MNRFINDDVKIKNGGRKAIKTTEQELTNKIIKKAQTFDSEVDNLLDAICTIFCEDESIMKDRKILVDTENISHQNDNGLFYKKHSIGDSLVGFHTFENGFTFLGIVMGGDWEFPIFTILYDDGKKIRCYTPSYGNPFNLDTKTAFGSEYESDNVDFDKLLSKYKKLGIVKPDDIGKRHSNTEWSDIYRRKYDINNEDELKFNWNAIKQDISSRIEMV